MLKTNAAFASAVCLLATVSVDAQQGARGGEWRSYAGEVSGTKYSPLDQIDSVNVQELRVAWRWRSVDHELADADPGVTIETVRGVGWSSARIT